MIPTESTAITLDVSGANSWDDPPIPIPFSRIRRVDLCRVYSLQSHRKDVESLEISPMTIYR